MRKLLGPELNVLRAELNSLKVACEEESLRNQSHSKELYKSQENFRDQLIKSNIKKIKVVYFFQQVTIWNSFKSVYEQLCRNEHFECEIVITSFKHDTENLENRESIDFLNKEEIPFSIYDEDSFDLTSVDIVFFQTPYDCSRPQELAVPKLVDKGIKIGYVPYGLDVGGGDDNLRWQYNLDCQNMATWVFVRSKRHKEFYGKFCSNGNSHVCVTGHPKFDQADYSVETSTDSNKRKVFLWTPHFSLEQGGWSTFDKFSETILSSAKSNDFDLIIRPHPLFNTRLESCSDELKNQYRNMLDVISEYPNVSLDPCDGSYIDSFKKSDLLIADAGSFLLEYLPSRKPIIYLNNLDGPGLNESGSFSKYLYTANNTVELTEHMKSILTGDDYMRAERVSIIEDEVFMGEHGAAYEICNTIIDTYNVKN